MIINAAGSKGGGSTPVINPLSVTENGTYTAPSGVDGYSPVVVNVSGGGGGSVEENDVNFYDYDGTCVASYSAADFAELTAMPSNPSHTGLTAQGWNWSLANAKGYVATYGMLDIGQMYVTDDGKTRLYCHFSKGRLDPYVGIGLNGTAKIDWGDGSQNDTITGSSTSTIIYTHHTYATEGDYIISIDITAGQASLAGANSSTGKSYVLTGYDTANDIYLCGVRKIEIGSGVKVSASAFAYMRGLESITIPQSAGNFNGTNYVFKGCGNLKCLILPDSAEYVYNHSFALCYVIRNISMSHDINLGGSGQNLFQNCYCLRKIALPDAITQISASMLNNCYSISILAIPSTVSTIASSGFQGLSATKELHLYPTSPPSLGSSTVFSDISSDCIIYVPYSADHSILNAYKTATNWSAQASKMVEEPAP